MLNHLHRPAERATTEQDEAELERALNRRESWHIWQLCEATDWQHLPFPGALLDQPDWFMEDVITIAARKRFYEHAPRLDALAGKGIHMRRLGRD